jgi:hypothetical protein
MRHREREVTTLWYFFLQFFQKFIELLFFGALRFDRCYLFIEDRRIEG